MRLITKGQEPIELTAWKTANRNGRYQNLDESEQGKLARQAIRKSAIQEQYGLCAYCCKQINESNSNNEHLVSQRGAPNRTLDFANIVASCTTPRRCNQERGSKNLPLTPLMPECETELRFCLSGKVEGITERAIEAIEVLALNTRGIREERKQLVDEWLFINGAPPDDLRLLDDQLLDNLLIGLQQPDDAGELPPFSPVLINIIRQLLRPAEI